MKFKIKSELEYQVFEPSTFILTIQASRTSRQIILEESLTVDPYVKIEEFTTENGGNRHVRMEVMESALFKIKYQATVDIYYYEINIQDLKDIAVAQMHPSVLSYLLPSRYCQSDKLQRLAYKLFGHIGTTYERVEAIASWVNQNIEYASGSTNSHTSAYDTITESAGVCRDFAHLSIALCRALSIPARYSSGYAYKLNPPDFHACFEVYIGGHWLLFDATKLAPLNGIVKIAHGRDATDVAVSTIFGNVNSLNVQVESEVEGLSFQDFENKNNSTAISIEYIL